MSLPYVKYSPTSRAAAAEGVERAETARERVYDWIARRGGAGATDDEIEAALGMRHQTASARRRELVLAGRVFDSGCTRPTRSGAGAAIWLVRGGAVQKQTDSHKKQESGGTPVVPKSAFQIASFSGLVHRTYADGSTGNAEIAWDGAAQTLTVTSIEMADVEDILGLLAGGDAGKVEVSVSVLAANPPAAPAEAPQQPTQPKGRRRGRPRKGSKPAEPPPDSPEGRVEGANADPSPPAEPEPSEAASDGPAEEDNYPAVDGLKPANDPEPEPPPAESQPAAKKSNGKGSAPQTDRTEYKAAPPATTRVAPEVQDDDPLLAKLKAAATLKDIIAVIRAEGHSSLEEILEVCNRYRGHVARLGKVGRLEDRVQTALAVLSD